MIKQKGPWRIVNTKEVYKNNWMQVWEDSVIRPDGKAGIFGHVDIQPGTSILAITDDNKILIEQEYRYSIERDCFELPSGGIENNLTPLETAQKELREETGYIANDWTSLGAIDPLTSIVKVPQHLFIAKGLHKGESTLEGTEVIVVHELPFDEVYRMVIDGRITHSPSVILILRARLMGII